MTFPRNTPETARRNRLLAALPRSGLEQLMAAIDPVLLPWQHGTHRGPVAQVVGEQGQPVPPMAFVEELRLVKQQLVDAVDVHSIRALSLNPFPALASAFCVSPASSMYSAQRR